ncbi:MAG: hypothetical protein ABJN26_16105 [Stappiaceae bacterium]
MSEEKKSEKSIELECLSGFFVRPDNGETFNDLSDLPDAESVHIDVMIKIASVWKPYDYQRFTVDIYTGTFAGDSCAYQTFMEFDGVEVGWASIYMTSFNGKKAQQIIEALIARCDEGSLINSRDALKDTFDCLDDW